MVLDFRTWLESVLQVDVRKLYAWEVKLRETMADVSSGSLSYSAGSAILVSRLDKPRGAFYIMDGHHRVVQAIMSGEASVVVEVSEHVPRIERTGGAYNHVLQQMVQVYKFVQSYGQE